LPSGAIPKRFSPGVKDAIVDRGAFITLAPAEKGGRLELTLLRYFVKEVFGWGIRWLARSSALQRAVLALALPAHKRHFAPGRLQLLASTTYRRAKPFESSRLRWISILSVGRRAALSASPERGDAE
jgi:hypothetical protein